jgi:predicted permease
MCILGANLSMTSMKKKTDTSATEVSRKTIAAIAFGKMVLMPIIGIVATLLLKEYVWHIPDDIDGPFYLVLMIVMITPTANNVMVMVELSESGSQEGMARIIAWQYAIAPIVLSISVMIVVRVACLL